MADLVKPSTVWRRAGEVLAGSAVGFLAWSFVGPGLIGWWYEPPSKDAFSCAGSVRAALGKFVVMQLVSAVTGAVVLAVVLFVGRRWWARRHAPSAGPPPPAG
jgi:hypothetical protein